LKYNWLEIHQNLEKHANKRLQQKCPAFRDPEIYDISLWLKYLWSYKQIPLTPSLLITLYIIIVYDIIKVILINPLKIGVRSTLNFEINVNQMYWV